MRRALPRAPSFRILRQARTSASRGSRPEASAKREESQHGAAGSSSGIQSVTLSLGQRARRFKLTLPTSAQAHSARVLLPIPFGPAPIDTWRPSARGTDVRKPISSSGRRLRRERHAAPVIVKKKPVLDGDASAFFTNSSGPGRSTSSALCALLHDTLPLSIERRTCGCHALAFAHSNDARDASALNTGGHRYTTRPMTKRSTGLE